MSSSGRGSSHDRPWDADDSKQTRRPSRLDNYVPRSAQRDQERKEQQSRQTSSANERFSVESNNSRSGESSYEQYLAQKQRQSAAGSARGGSSAASRLSSDRRQDRTKTSPSLDRPNRSQSPSYGKYSDHQRSSGLHDESSARVKSSRREDRSSTGRIGALSASARASSISSAPGSGEHRRYSSSDRSGTPEESRNTDKRRSSSKSALEYGGGGRQVDASRELRARRLRHERKSSEGSTKNPLETDSSDNQSKPSQYQAHSVGVRTGNSNAGIPVQPAFERRGSISRQQELEAKRLAREAEMAKLRQARQERDAQRQAFRSSARASITGASANPDDETMRTTDASTRGWSTKSKSTSVATDEGSSVGRYLAMRKKREESDRSEDPVTDTKAEPQSFATYGDDSSCSSSSDDDTITDEQSSDEEPGETEWSIRVSVVSAIDFPSSVVPNLPLSPVLTIGIVGCDSDSKDGKAKVAKEIENGGIMSVPKSRVLCTSSKVLSKRDNGSVEFHEELRWDRVRKPQSMALGIELSARAVIAPANSKESPPSQSVQPLQFTASSSRIQTTGSGESGAGIGSLFRRQRGVGEMETANAAAAVAHLLVKQDGDGDSHASDADSVLVDSKASPRKHRSSTQSEMNVKLRRRKSRKRTKETKDLRLGSRLVPFSMLPLKKALSGNEEARIEQWFELENTSDLVKSPTATSPSSKGSSRNPSILLEITLSSPERMDDSEDDMMEDDDSPEVIAKASFAKRESIKIRNQLKQEVVKVEEKEEEPMLEPGVVDFVCVVGARDIGDQKADDGSSGWVNSTPECCVLEQFPPNDEFHINNGRMTVLPNKIEWFCLPEGCRLWRGSTPPNADELNLRRFTASSPASMSSSVAAFDANLGCTTSFSWFVIASNSDEYGSETAKTYGACIRFYVPAPAGIDPTQDDFAQMLMGMEGVADTQSDGKRLWVPIGICLTSSLPIVGVLEAMLLRLCERFSMQGLCSFSGVTLPAVRELYEDIAHLIVNFQRPVAGVVNCSIPFLSGERLHIALPPRSGLPALPHGNAISSVCRLLGSDGVNYLLATLLSESKVLLHSDDISNLCLVAEVMTALMYPFQWACPYVPVLPAEMMEFLEAPVSFILGIPSCNIRLVEPHVLEEIVVVDLDRDFCPGDEYYGESRVNVETLQPVPLPYSMSSNISRAVQSLLRNEEEVDDVLVGTSFPANQSQPRLEQESLAEREFRLTVAVEVCNLLRGFQDCLVYASASRPVFNVEKFLETAPALYDEARGVAPPQPTERKGLSVVAHGVRAAQKVAQKRAAPPQSEAFLSCLVNCQHFHQLVETLDSDHLSFFREIMESINSSKKSPQGSLGWHLSSDPEAALSVLGESLQKQEDKIPTFRVKKFSKLTGDVNGSSTPFETFPTDLLKQIVVAPDASNDTAELTGGVKQLSLEYLVELEKNPWRYHKLFEIDVGQTQAEPFVVIGEKVKLRDAIGERRFRAWKMALDHDGDEGSLASEDSRSRSGKVPLDLSSLANFGSDKQSTGGRDSPQKRVSDAKDRDVLRRCLELANASPGEGDKDKDLSIISDAERSLRNPAARQFLLSILGNRWQQGGVGKGLSRGESFKGQIKASSAGETLSSHAFEILVRVGCAMLDACFDSKDYGSAYSLLKLTAGLQTTTGNERATFVTARISLHPMYADLGMWDKVKSSHISNRQEAKNEEDEDKAEYDAVVATLYEMLGYGIPAEELSRFVSRQARQNGWFVGEKGQKLLMLARKLCVRRDQGSSGDKQTTDIEMMSPNTKSSGQDGSYAAKSQDLQEVTWIETSWCHPAAQSSKKFNSTDRATRRSTGTQNLLNMLDEQKLPNAGGHNSKHMKRSAVTCMSYLGQSVVVTGGLDGGVFLARRVANSESTQSTGDREWAGVCGIHLDWGSSGSRYNVGSASTSLDGEYGVGSVSCLAGTRNSANKHSDSSHGHGKGVLDCPSDEELLSHMDGCRVVAGTTCGDLRVWAIKDVFTAVFFSGGVEEEALSERNASSGAPGTTTQRRRSADLAAGSSLTRLKFSLRGRALSGHRGGVSCIDVPSNVYRPDSIVSGGADGLIKLWSLRSPAMGSSRRTEIAASPSSSIAQSSKGARGGDALSILSGHGGRVLCVKTAWHGDRLLSGGADRTVRLWDIAGSNGRCLNALWGHFGWVSHVEFWGPNTIISASTDRSIALWDARVQNSPLFSLRHHYAPISSLLVGSRTDPIMISAANDGTVAAWDFRQLSGAKDSNSVAPGTETKTNRCRNVREPVATYFLNEYSSSANVCGPVRLCRGQSPGVFQCVGRDAVVRDWDMHSGEVLAERNTGHCDTISNFSTIQGDKVDGTKAEDAPGLSSTITTSWDGTIRMRRLVHRRKD